ncbi:MAG TPA: hypothetical protein GX497_16480 [Bacillus bacterium]|nr:hypothetical protein [Bacillus sp. (in: firmicutes)]
MQVDELIKEINKYVEELDFVTTRKLIESNIEVLKDHKFLLKSNARELLKLINDQLESGREPLSRKEMSLLLALNSYANNFDLTSIKLIVKNNAKLFLKNDVVDYLNKDAITLLEGLGVIHKKEMIN